MCTSKIITFASVPLSDEIEIEVPIPDVKGAFNGFVNALEKGFNQLFNEGDEEEEPMTGEVRVPCESTRLYDHSQGELITVAKSHNCNATRADDILVDTALHVA